MVVHMTDDIKELCGLTEVTSPSTVNICLYGADAEAAGLWSAALKAVVQLVTCSCRHQSSALLKDFDEAGGYHLLFNAIGASSGKRVPKLLELVSNLACCPVEGSRDRDISDETEIEGLDGMMELNPNDSFEFRLASNPDAFEIVEDIIVKSVPFLNAYTSAHGGERPEFDSDESLRKLTSFSVSTARALRADEEGNQSDKYDVSSDLLVTTLQLYSDHAKNYPALEMRYNILAHYLLAFPTFSNVGVKVLILKTLEYVCTGLVGTDALKPLTIANEIFFALCKSLLQGPTGDQTLDSEKEKKIYESLLQDTQMLCSTLEKLLEFDDKTSEIMVDGGLLDHQLNDFLALVAKSIDQSNDCHFVAFRKPGLDDDDTDEVINITYPPPESTGMDGAYTAVCRVLKPVLCERVAAGYPILPFKSSTLHDGTKISEVFTDLGRSIVGSISSANVLLAMGIKELGVEASEAALSVFESMMTSQIDFGSLCRDMDCLIAMLDFFSELTAQACGVTATKASGSPKKKKRKAKKPTNGNIELKTSVLLREAMVLNSIKSILQTSEHAQTAFRRRGGFECMARLIVCLNGVVEMLSPQHMDSIVPDESEVHGLLLKVIESSLALVAAAISSRSKNEVETRGMPTSSMAIDLFFEKDSLTQSVDESESASVANRSYLRSRGFYLAFARAVSETGILNSPEHAQVVVNLALSFLEPSLLVDKGSRTSGNLSNRSLDEDEHMLIRNPEGARFILGLAVWLPSTPDGIALSKHCLDQILLLCSPDRVGTTLSQIAFSGLMYSLTNPLEFAPFCMDRSHHLYSHFEELIRRIASFNMSYMDFTSLLRCVAGPLLRVESLESSMEGTSSSFKHKQIRLPIISSSMRPTVQKTVDANSPEQLKVQEADFCSRLETLAVIAELGDRVPHCQLGGGSLNEITSEKQLYEIAEHGDISFLEVESIESSAHSSGTAEPQVYQEKIWMPLQSSGFSYSLWLRVPLAPGRRLTGSLFVLDLSSTPANNADTNATVEFLSLWYDLQQQRFCVISSSSYRHEPTCFPVSPLLEGVWHHILLTYLPPKRPMLSRKATLGLFVDGRPLEAEVRVESVNLPPSTRAIVGIPNPLLSSSGVVRGSLPTWDLGPTMLFSACFGSRDATAIFVAGPDFEGAFCGDRPQRLSLTATATATFSMLAESGERGSVAGALRRRGLPEIEAAGHVMREKAIGGGRVNSPDSDSLSVVGLLCAVPPDCVVFAFRASASTGMISNESQHNSKRHYSRCLANISRLYSSNETVSCDAWVYGRGSIRSPRCFADNVQWAGGPNILMPLVNAARSSQSLALILRLIRVSVHRHPPNLEMLQVGGGYRILGLLLRQKRVFDAETLDQCFGFAVHGFIPGPKENPMSETTVEDGSNIASLPSWEMSEKWVFADLDAMKYLLLNHQVWDLRGSGPELPLRLISFLNALVAARSTHSAFNSRRLHLLGIIRWTLHLMLEATELYSLGHSALTLNADTSSVNDGQVLSPRKGAGVTGHGVSSTAAAVSAQKNGWSVSPPSTTDVAVGGDPNIALMLGCKTLLRRVLTYMLTPGDLEAIAGATIYTLSITGKSLRDLSGDSDQNLNHQDDDADEKLPPGPSSRVYLIRLLEELVVDGVNEIVTASIEKNEAQDRENPPKSAVAPHSGGGTSANASYLASKKRTNRSTAQANRKNSSDVMNPKHQQAQAFLSAFAGILTPVWFACILEGCREEASASAVLRLLILMLQSSPIFAAAFEEAGGFAPLVLSIPKFSTCASIIMSMLCQLLHAPILCLPCFGTLKAAQLCEVFDVESDAPELIYDNIRGGVDSPADPSCGIFALLAECLGRNIQLASFENSLGLKARQTNEAVIQLLGHRHTYSPAFQEFCRTPDFLEPLSQALCLVHDEMLQRIQQNAEEKEAQGQIDDNDNRNRMQMSMSRRGSLMETVTSETPTERFVGKSEEHTTTSGIGMVKLLHQVLSHAVFSGALAAPLVSALFRSFPIHASPDQVEAFHLVLMEHCRSVIDDGMQRGKPIAIANCVGVSSVLLDRLMAGFFTSGAVLDAVKIVLKTLASLTSSDTHASQTLGAAELAMLIADTAHLSRITCLAALQRSHPIGPYDAGDDDLKLAVLELISQNLRILLLVPNGKGGSRRQLSGTSPTPIPGHRLYPLWESASLVRCSPPSIPCIFSDLATFEEPDRAFVVALMAEMHSLLVEKRNDVREEAVVIIVNLLQQRRGFMSELLITDVPRGDQMETVDLMNRGGFGALLVAHEAAIAENVGTVPRRSGSAKKSASGGKMKYASFFEWLKRNQSQVGAVFQNIHLEASELHVVDIVASSPEEAIETEQKAMLLKLTSQDSSDRTILGGLERAELAQRSHEKTAESHGLWKRQGFDDLSSGAMQWKFLLRQLKGSCSIWEGGFFSEQQSPFSAHRLLVSLGKTRLLGDQKEAGEVEQKINELASIEVVTRWKLDLTEGYERQRRRMLPNYEFNTLYNLDEDEKVDNSGNSDGLRSASLRQVEDDVTEKTEVSDMLSTGNDTDPARKSILNRSIMFGDSMEATAALLKEMNLGTRVKEVEDDYDPEAIDEGEEDMHTSSTTMDSTFATERAEASFSSRLSSEQDTHSDVSKMTSQQESADLQKESDDSSSKPENLLASSYEVITGLLRAGDWPEKSYNVSRCTGLEVRKALLLWCHSAIYIVDGFEQTDGEGLEGKINRLEKESSSFYINLRPQNFTERGEQDGMMHHSDGGIKEETEAERIKSKEKSVQDSSEEVSYEHRSQRIGFNDMYSVYRRRYQLQQIALEFFDIHRNSILIAFSNNVEREEVLAKVLGSQLPNSIFNSTFLAATTQVNYKKFMNSLRAKITSQWVNGKMSNFDFLMHLNSFAGRSYNDLTQYPVFPWVIADYESEELDLSDPKTYRDLSKPMGAQGASRAVQFRERYEALEANYLSEDEPPPFHYGTHYSCAAYVLYYLMRLEPFSRLALSLQGGRFDVADRLFHNIGSSWRSSSSENLQDVRELIPEFFYFPQFLVNSNMFDFGTTQMGKTVHDVTLPPWAKGDPKRFVRMNRQALESEHVSKDLHKWVDLIFGYKQRGREAAASLNTFVHVTYEGQVDLDAITDPIQRESTIAQIHNFGQTPSRLERRPFPQRNVVVAVKDGSIDFSALALLAPLTPPFCVVGAPRRVFLRGSSLDTRRVGISGQADSSVGDVCLIKGSLIGVGRTCTLLSSDKRYVRFGGPNNGLSIHTAVSTARYREVNRVISVHGNMHCAPISAVRPSLNGQWLVTGCFDSTVRVWKYSNSKVDLRATLCGHDGGPINCIDISTSSGCIVTGGADGKVLLWNLRTLQFLTELRNYAGSNAYGVGVNASAAVISVSINHKTGNILTLVGSSLTLFDINGNVLVIQNMGDDFGESNRATCAVATDCPGWMESGVVAVTGHANGDIRLWSLDTDNDALVMQHLVPEQIHSSPITVLRCAGDRQDTLLVGDASGKLSVWKTLQLENLTQQELGVILQQITSDP
eukprot:scaffold29466_cov56-Attheya_sp.AAC.2